MEEPTTGNIRSVNVDYLPEPEEQQRTSSLGWPSPGLPKFAPLDAAILESLQELSGQRADGARSQVHVAALIEHLRRRYANQIELPPVEYIDCALNGLERAGKLVTKPMDGRQVEAALKASGQRERQSVFVDRWLLAAASSPTADGSQLNSKSTTLDSGIRSWDQRRESRSPSNHNQQQQLAPAAPAKRSSFSLRRSLSFRPQQTNSNKQQRSWRQTAERTRMAAHEEEEQRPVTRQSTKLASLFRSRSLRALPGGRWAADRRQATIDYLATPVQQHQAAELGPNRLLHFLRRLFRSSQPQSTRTVSSREQRLATAADDRQRLAAHFSQQASPQATLNGLANNSNKLDAAPATAATGQQLLAGSPSSSSRSSGTDSLIEILDCSPALAGSRRKLREAQVGLGRPTRASRRRLERSNSSLSQSSCSTTRSTASQQLRRHLDEAYRRHRKCSSQREREFIDSINVLRQASRHALLEGQTKCSRSPVKGRAKGGNQSDADSAEHRECLCESQQHHSCGQQEPEPTPAGLDLIAQPTPDSLVSDCCLCMGGRLCPALAYCPALTCGGRRQPPSSGDDTGACPLWLSLLYGPAACTCDCGYNYGCSTYGSTSTNHYPLPPAELLQRQQLVAGSQQLHQHQQSQQHQHNTTIDLKIEIGDFLAAAAVAQNQTTNSRRPAREPDDDSLDSDLATDESLAKLDLNDQLYEQEQYSADSSLRAH